MRKIGYHEDTKDLLVMSSDGKGIVMHHADLRELTKKAAERSKSKFKKRLGKGEKRNRKRMSTVASVYTIEEHVRTPEQIMGSHEINEAGKPLRARNKRVWASVEREPWEVINEVFQEALRRDPLKQREWVMPVDGEPRQLEYIKECMERYKVDVTIVLDFIHVLEYLWKASHCLNAAGSEQAEEWVGERALHILNGQISNVAAGMCRSATLRELDTKKREPIDKCAGYILKYKNFLNYGSYIKRGLPIATGKPSMIILLRKSSRN